MQEFKKPWRELTKEFTNSELAIMTWAGKEQSASLKSKQPEKKSPVQLSDLTQEEFLDRGQGANVGKVEIDEHTDMRKFKGKDLLEYYQKQGIAFPVVSKDGMRNTPASKWKKNTRITKDKEE